MDNVKDYQTFTTKDTPKEERRRYNVGDLWSNSVRCLVCNDIIRSRNRHDFVKCTCGECSVDGGSWYNKVSSLGRVELLLEYYNDVEENERYKY